MPSEPRNVGVFIFEDFEPLDVFGPVQMLGALRNLFKIHLLGPEAGTPVTSSLGQRVLADRAWEDASALDIIMVPGGSGTRREVSNERLAAAIRRHAETAELVTSVCTGAAILAAAGLLDGRRATSNKLAFEWVKSQGPQVDWIAEARWVEDGNRVTSGGVAAGIDMAVYLVARLHGISTAERIANGLDYRWHASPADDPFAAMAGLV
jgi:transcriptional regulator GlxA family with amidase domain